MTSGKCIFCNDTFSKSGMTKHLESCQQKKVSAKTSKDEPSPPKVRSFHIVVAGRDRPEYWMHLEVRADTRLKALDNFLRNTWLECCGHLSSFTIKGRNYDSDDKKAINTLLETILALGLVFYHEYDFGSTTELVLEVKSEWEGEVGNKPVRLLAMNDPPLKKCVLCGKTATLLCTECIGSDKEWLCDECAPQHPCDEDLYLPVVNSPRMGICGYVG